MKCCRSSDMIINPWCLPYDETRVNRLKKWPPKSWRHFQVHVLQWKCTILLKISLKFGPKDQINNITALVQIMAWRRSADKSSSEPMMVRLPIYASLGLNELTQMNWHSTGPQGHFCRRDVVVNLANSWFSTVFNLSQGRKPTRWSVWRLSLAAAAAASAVDSFIWFIYPMALFSAAPIAMGCREKISQYPVVSCCCY